MLEGPDRRSKGKVPATVIETKTHAKEENRQAT